MKDSLNKIRDEVEHCRRCPLYQQARNAVPGEGPKHARLFFIGQAPGAVEDMTGRPFVGRSGKFLESLLNSVGISREEVFLTSVVKHFPPKNRAPKKFEMEACTIYLERQLMLVDPEIVIFLGRAAEALRPVLPLDGRKVLVMVHPSAAQRFPAMRKRMAASFEELRQIVNRKDDAA